MGLNGLSVRSDEKRKKVDQWDECCIKMVIEQNNEDLFTTL